MWNLVKLLLIDTCKRVYINIKQLLAKLRSADEDGSVVASVGPKLRFPGRGLLHVVREVQELPQEPCFCLIFESSGGKAPSFSPSLGRSCCFFSFHCLPWSKGENSFPSPRVLSRCGAAMPGWPRSCQCWTGSRRCLVCVAVTPARQQEPNHALLAPSEPDFKRHVVSARDAGSDSGWDGCVYVGFRTLIARFTPSNLYSLLWFKRIMSNIKSPQLSRR